MTPPERSLGYQHPVGEVHITQQGLWEKCPGAMKPLDHRWPNSMCFLGQENPSTLCIDGTVPIFIAGHLADHSGPYNGIMM